MIHCTEDPHRFFFHSLREFSRDKTNRGCRQRHGGCEDKHVSLLTSMSNENQCKLVLLARLKRTGRTHRERSGNREFQHPLTALQLVIDTWDPCACTITQTLFLLSRKERIPRENVRSWIRTEENTCFGRSELIVDLDLNWIVLVYRRPRLTGRRREGEVGNLGEVV